MSAPVLSDAVIREAALLRVDGITYPRIATHLGLRSRRTAWGAVRRAVQRGMVRADQLPAPKSKPEAAKPVDRSGQPKASLPYKAPRGLDKDWRTQAACRGEDPELFYAAGTWAPPAARAQAKEAKAVCDRCPVVAACLADALASGDDWAVRGRLTPSERRRLRQRNGGAS